MFFQSSCTSEFVGWGTKILVAQKSQYVISQMVKRMNNSFFIWLFHCSMFFFFNVAVLDPAAFFCLGCHCYQFYCVFILLSADFFLYCWDYFYYVCTLLWLYSKLPCVSHSQGNHEVKWFKSINHTSLFTKINRTPELQWIQNTSCCLQERWIHILKKK